MDFSRRLYGWASEGVDMYGRSFKVKESSFGRVPHQPAKCKQNSPRAYVISVSLCQFFPLSSSSLTLCLSAYVCTYWPMWGPICICVGPSVYA